MHTPTRTRPQHAHRHAPTRTDTNSSYNKHNQTHNKHNKNKNKLKKMASVESTVKTNASKAKEAKKRDREEPQGAAVQAGEKKAKTDEAGKTTYKPGFKNSGAPRRPKTTTERMRDYMKHKGITVALVDAIEKNEDIYRFYQQALQDYGKEYCQFKVEQGKYFEKIKKKEEEKRKKVQAADEKKSKSETIQDLQDCIPRFSELLAEENMRYHNLQREYEKVQQEMEDLERDVDGVYGGKGNDDEAVYNEKQLEITRRKDALRTSMGGCLMVIESLQKLHDDFLKDYESIVEKKSKSDTLEYETFYCNGEDCDNTIDCSSLQHAYEKGWLEVDHAHYCNKCAYDEIKKKDH